MLSCNGKNKSSDLEKNGREMSCKTKGDTMCKNSLGIMGTKDKKTCSYDIPSEEITMVHFFLGELFKSLKWKDAILERKEKMFSKKLIELWYNMDDHMVLVVEVQEGFDVV